jgi:hypothetical protein
MKPTILLFVALLTLASCKKEDSNPVQQIVSTATVTDYFPLDNGDSWVYQLYAADSSLIFIQLNDSDVVSVIGDSLIAGTSYKIVNSSYWGISLYRDSADYIVDQTGWKFFTIDNTSEYLVNQYQPFTDSTQYNTSVVRNSDSTCTVPAGQFQARFVVGTITATKPTTPAMKTRNYYLAFSKNVGLVLKRVIYALEPNYIEERLIHYHLALKTN